MNKARIPEIVMSHIASNNMEAKSENYQFSSVRSRDDVPYVSAATPDAIYLDSEQLKTLTSWPKGVIRIHVKEYPQRKIRLQHFNPKPAAHSFVPNTQQCNSEDKLSEVKCLQSKTHCPTPNAECPKPKAVSPELNAQCPKPKFQRKRKAVRPVSDAQCLKPKVQHLKPTDFAAKPNTDFTMWKGMVKKDTQDSSPEITKKHRNSSDSSSVSEATTMAADITRERVSFLINRLLTKCSVLTTWEEEQFVTRKELLVNEILHGITMSESFCPNNEDLKKMCRALIKDMALQSGGTKNFKLLMRTDWIILFKTLVNCVQTHISEYCAKSQNNRQDGGRLSRLWTIIKH